MPHVRIAAISAAADDTARGANARTDATLDLPRRAVKTGEDGALNSHKIVDLTPVLPGVRRERVGRCAA
jgi:hypothetical protein